MCEIVEHLKLKLNEQWLNKSNQISSFSIIVIVIVVVVIVIVQGIRMTNIAGNTLREFSIPFLNDCSCLDFQFGIH